MEKKTNILLIKKKKSKSVRTEDYHFVWRCDAGHVVRATPYGMTRRKETYIDDIEVYASKVSWRNRTSTRKTPYVSEKEKCRRYLKEVHEETVNSCQRIGILVRQELLRLNGKVGRCFGTNGAEKLVLHGMLKWHQIEQQIAERWVQCPVMTPDDMEIQQGAVALIKGDRWHSDRNTIWQTSQLRIAEVDWYWLVIKRTEAPTGGGSRSVSDVVKKVNLGPKSYRIWARTLRRVTERREQNDKQRCLIGSNGTGTVTKRSQNDLMQSFPRVKAYDRVHVENSRRRHARRVGGQDDRPEQLLLLYRNARQCLDESETWTCCSEQRARRGRDSDSEIPSRVPMSVPGRVLYVVFSTHLKQVHKFSGGPRMKRKSSFVSDSLDTSWSDSVVIKIMGKTSGPLKDDFDILSGRQTTFFWTTDPDVSDEKSGPGSDDRYKVSYGPRKERR